jgi:hypothetical protein
MLNRSEYHYESFVQSVHKQQQPLMAPSGEGYCRTAKDIALLFHWNGVLAIFIIETVQINQLHVAMQFDPGQSKEK